MLKLKSSFNVTSFGKITTAVVLRAVRSILSKICTRWYKIALSREHVVPVVDGVITGSPLAHYVSVRASEVIWSEHDILELLVYYLMPNKCKTLKDMKSSCLSICTSSL